MNYGGFWNKNSDPRSGLDSCVHQKDTHRTDAGDSETPFKKHSYKDLRKDSVVFSTRKRNFSTCFSERSMVIITLNNAWGPNSELSTWCVQGKPLWISQKALQLGFFFYFYPWELRSESNSRKLLSIPLTILMQDSELLEGTEDNRLWKTLTGHRILHWDEDWG